MTDLVINNVDTVTEENELTTLKEIATNLGISFRDNISAQTLKERINAVRQQSENEDQSKNQLRVSLKKDGLALKRVRISSTNPLKRGIKGELFCVGNSYIGNIRRYIPYNTVWHVEKILLNFIKSKKYILRNTIEDPITKTVKIETVETPEYVIEELPQLTKEELKDLAKAQLARSSVDNNI